MLPIAKLRLEWRDGEFYVEFFTHCDHPWLRDLIEELEALAGRPWREFERRWGARAHVDRRVGIALVVIARKFTRRVEAKVKPSVVRQLLFETAADCQERDAALLRVASKLELDVADIERAMFADLPDERRLVLPDPAFDPTAIAALCNREVVATVLCRAERVMLWCDGQARVLVRHCQLRELPFTVQLDAVRGGMRIDLVGPLAVSKGARRRASRIGELLGFLPWCRRYRLVADCLHKGKRGRFVLASGDPILPATEPRRFDSLVEERFYRDFTRATSAWELVREPVAVALDGRLVFPDFSARRRADGEERWIEIIGYWREDYLRSKTKWLDLEGVILCVDRALDFGEVGCAAVVIRYDERIDVGDVMACLSLPVRGSGA